MALQFDIQEAKKRGYSDEQIQQIIAQGPPQARMKQSQVPQEQAPQGPQRQGIAKWLPLLGGVVGGIAGAPLGGVGGIAGGALGSGGGEWLAELLSGEDTSAKKIGKEVALGTLGGVAGKGLQVGGRGIMNLLGRGGSEVTGEIAEQVGRQVSKGPQIGARTYASAFQVPSKVARWVKPVETSQELIDHGVTGSLPQIKAKSTQVLNTVGKIRRDILSAIPEEVDIRNVSGVASKSLERVSDLSKAESQRIMRTLFRMQGKNMGKLPHTMDAVDALDNIQELRNTGFQYINQSTKLSPNLRSEQIGEVYLSVADAIEDQIERTLKGKGGDIIAQFKQPQIVEQLRQISPKLAQQFTDAKDLRDIGSLMKPFVRANKMVDITEDAAQSVGGNVSNRVLAGLLLGGGGLATGGTMAIPAAAAGFVGSPILEGLMHAARAPISTAAGRAISGAGQTAVRAGSSSLLQNMISSGAGQSLARTFDNQPVIEGEFSEQNPEEASLQNIQEPQDQGSQIMNSLLGENPQQKLQQLAVLDLLAGGDNTTKLIALAKMFGENEGTNDVSSEARTALNVLGKLQSAYQQVQNQGLTAQSGGLGRLIGSAKGNVAALTQSSPEASAYKDQTESFLSLITRGLGERGVLTDRDVERVRKAIPHFSDSPEAADRKWKLIQSIIQEAVSKQSGSSQIGSEDESSLLQYLQ